MARFVCQLSPRAAAAAVLLSLVATMSACGGDDAPTAGSTPATTAEDLVAPVGGEGNTTPESAAEGAGTVSGGAGDKGTGDFTPPAGADAPGAPRVPLGRGIRLTAADGQLPRWVVKANRGEDGDFCMHLSIPGPYDPDPLCQTGELLALQFFSDDGSGPAVGTVIMSPRTRRESPTEMVVAGLASGDVKRVRVRYGTELFDATLSEEVADVPIDRRLARELSGATRAQIDRLPDPVTVRAFGVSFPRDAGNPPRVVTPEAPRAIDGVITLQLS